MSWKRSNPNCNGDKVKLRTTCNKNVTFKIIKIRTSRHVAYYYYSKNLNWASTGCMQNHGLDIAGLGDKV